MLTTNKTWVRVCQLDELPTNKAINVHINNQRLVVARCGDAAYIAQGYCSHMLYALKDAPIADCVITCPLHGSQFNLQDGSIAHWPLPITDEVRARKTLRTYETEVREGVLYVAWATDEPDKVRVRLQA